MREVAELTYAGIAEDRFMKAAVEAVSAQDGLLPRQVDTEEVGSVDVDGGQRGFDVVRVVVAGVGQLAARPTRLAISGSSHAP